MLGHGEPIRVKEGDRVMLRILNGSATLHRRIAAAGHVFHVTAMDGNPVGAPRDVEVLELGPAERIDAVIEMKNPGVWVLGETNDKERRNGLGIAIEYAGRVASRSGCRHRTRSGIMGRSGALRRRRQARNPASAFRLSSRRSLRAADGWITGLSTASSSRRRIRSG